MFDWRGNRLETDLPRLMYDLQCLHLATTISSTGITLLPYFKLQWYANTSQWKQRPHSGGLSSMYMLVGWFTPFPSLSPLICSSILKSNSHRHISCCHHCPFFLIMPICTPSSPSSFISVLLYPYHNQINLTNGWLYVLGDASLDYSTWKCCTYEPFIQNNHSKYTMKTH